MAGEEKGRGVPPGRGARSRATGGGSLRTRNSDEGSTARAAAIHRLQRVEEGGAYVARVGGDLRPDEARLASDLVAGVTRLRRRLDFLLAPHVRGGLERLDGPVRQALRVGLYDMLERGTPAHAAVGEAVEAAGRVTHRGGASLVNAVLRSAARALASGDQARPVGGDPAEDLAVWYSYPTWLVRRWLARRGPEETEALLEAGNRVPAFGIRANLLKTSVEALAASIGELGVESVPSRWIDDVLVVRRLQPILHDGLLREGRAAVQDEAAALVVRVLDPQPGEAIMDAAAAPGGKALYAAERMNNRGRVVAVDVHAGKLNLLERAAAEHGVTIIEPLALDVRAAAGRPALAGSFDRVLVDAPCSGLGVLARRADLRWKRSESEIDALTRIQNDMLDAAAAAVRPGGLLVYSTCSIEREENEDRVGAFLSRHVEFAREDVGDLVAPELRTPAGDYAALPHTHGIDGAYAARLRRTD